MTENKLVVADAGWAKDIPKWLLDEVETERLMSGFITLLGKGKPECGDAEACAYLYTLCLTVPVDEQTTRIYLYLVTKLMQRRDMNVPKDIQITSLSEWDNGALRTLKQEIYHKRGGEITSPIFDILKELKRGCKNGTKTRDTDSRVECDEPIVQGVRGDKESNKICETMP